MSPARKARIALPPLVGALLLLAGGLLGGCSDAGSEDEPSAQATPIGELDPDALAPQRAPFCDRIPEDAVSAAVGDLAETRHYANGERARLSEGVTDVAHENGCVFVGEEGRVAQAWVFAPAVTEERARGLARAVTAPKECRTLDAGGFGSPRAAAICAGEDGPTASYHGLFGSTWFACSLRAAGSDEPTGGRTGTPSGSPSGSASASPSTSPTAASGSASSEDGAAAAGATGAPDLAKRAGRWCVQAVTAAG